MKSISLQTGFPVAAKHKFLMGGRRRAVNFVGVETVKHLEHVYACFVRRDCLTPLNARVAIREIERLNAREVLTLVIRETPNPKLRLLAIWLRGRCGGYVGTSDVARYCFDNNRVVRREAARCLKRLSGWSDLRRMLVVETDQQLRRFATVRPNKPFAERLFDLKRNVTVLPGDKSIRAELFVRSDLSLHTGRPAKTQEFIRAILKRIHHLVAG